MHLRGIHYDVGTETLDGSLTRPILTDAEIERDIDDIAGGLRASAIRITGGEVGRLASAGEIAARRGLEVWLSPMIPNADAATTLARVAETAQVAEELRRNGHAVVVVVGCELSVFMAGILPGATHGDRLTLLSDPARLVAEVTAAGIDPQATFDGFLRQAVDTVRSVFRGQVAYAAGMWEEVDWTPFDLVGVDAYRDAGARDGYASRLRGLSQHGKPVVVTETGCATYTGAADAGGLAWTAVDRSATPRRLREGIVRDEDGQARELDGATRAHRCERRRWRLRVHLHRAQLPVERRPGQRPRHGLLRAGSQLARRADRTEGRLLRGRGALCRTTLIDHHLLVRRCTHQKAPLGFPPIIGTRASG